MTQSATALALEPSRWRRARPDVVGVAWLVLVAVVFLGPAFWHGSHIGTYDILNNLGLSKHHPGFPHNPVNSDQIDAMIPWSHLVWTEVHQGHLPLWNPYAGLGLPLAFNWQSAPLGLPALVGYLFPVQYAYDIGQLVTLVVAGTGVYLLTRLFGLGVLAAAFGATVFELSGPLTGWLGFPHGAVMSCGGWLMAAAVLVVRPTHRVGAIVFFAVVLAFTVYSGQPEVLAVFGLAVALFVGVILVLRLPLIGGSGGILRPIGDLVVATVAGVALSAPLALPGFQAVGRSTRNGLGAVRPLQPHYLMYFIAQGFDGLPLAYSRVFGGSFFYEETAAFVGIIAVVLALIGLSTRIRRPEVIALAVVTAVMVAIAFVPPVNSFMDGLPALGKVSWDRTLMAIALGAAGLSAFGLDALVRQHTDRKVLRWSGAWFGAAGIVLAVVFVVGRGDLPSAEASIRVTSFFGPAFGIVAGLVVVMALAWYNRRARTSERFTPAHAGTIAGLALLACETVFLLSSGMPILSSSAAYLPPTPAEVALKQAVGNSLVGFGPSPCGQLGEDPSLNDVYGVYEFDAYDPIIPGSYYTSWVHNTHTGVALQAYNEFCPEITTLSEARLYGVSYVLEHSGTPGPTGSTFVRTVGDESLYSIPHSGIATVTALGHGGALPPVEAMGTPVPTSRPGPASLRVTVSAPTPQVLRVRLSDLPGWHATIDGRPLPLESYAGMMLQARVPSGHHTIVFRYWPATLTVGLIMALLSAAGLATALVVAHVHKRRRSLPNGPALPDESGPDVPTSPVNAEATAAAAIPS